MPEVEATLPESAGYALAGYALAGYAQSLAEFGQPMSLPRSCGWLLSRSISGSDQHDALGCYPLFACARWDLLEADLSELSGRMVSVGLVPDPFHAPEESELRRLFPHLVPFKRHFIADLACAPEKFVSKHHRYYVRRSLRDVRVEVAARPMDYLEEWCSLYAELVRRHELRGIKAFSQSAFAAQLALPGVTLLRAVAGSETVGAHLWFTQGEVGFSHLAAFRPRGYELMAAYALYWHALEHFRGRVRVLNLGAGAGLDPDAKDGLTQFKRGWASDTRTVWFAGRVLKPDVYSQLCRERGERPGYFPAYRTPEW